MTFTIAQAEHVLLVTVRVLAITMVAPVFSTSRYPAPAKIGLALVVAGIIVPTLPPIEETWGLFPLAFLVGQEFLVGLIIGFCSLIAFVGVQMAATYIGLQAGFRMADMLNPNMPDLVQQQGSSLEQVYTVLVVLVFLAVDGHHWIIMGIQRSFDLAPVGPLALDGLAGERLVTLASTLFTIALSIAMPIMGTLLLLDVALAIIARAVPQVQVFFVGAPVKMALGLVTLILSLPWMASYMVDRLGRVIDDMLIVLVA
ncbi:MAG TPA: flagellar biosynthetic protein FliR [Chloroflexi bacterium]|nr:flagellar biosynthetic protein FliR [Chloroflexota bacterium]